MDSLDSEQLKMRKYLEKKNWKRSKNMKKN